MKRSILAASLAAVLLAGTSACGALFNGGPARLNVTSSPDTAEVWVDGTRRGTTPLSIELSKKTDHTIVYKRAGYQDLTLNVTKKLQAGYVVLDVLGGLVPLIIDGATKSWYVLDRKDAHGILQPQVGLHGTLTDRQLALIMAGAPAAQVIDFSTGVTGAR